MRRETKEISKTMKLLQLPVTPLLLLFLLCATLSSAAMSATTINQFLAPQNAIRKALRLQPLKWDNRLATYAQWWGNQRKMDCSMVHSNGPYGENIFWGAGQRWTPGQAVAGWISERRWYDYLTNTCVGVDCGHYTQIVWRTTNRVGCAKVICLRGAGTLFVCDYDPPGNFDGERPY